MKNKDTLSLMEKTADSSRSLLFGLLVNCIFSDQVNGNCPLSPLRETLTFEEKYNFVMGLSKDEVCDALSQHEICYENECCPQCGIDTLAS